MNNAHLLHGYNVSDGGQNTTDKLIPTFNSLGFYTIQHDYGWLRFRGVLRKNKDIASSLVDKVLPNDIGIGHSNGCAILVKACRQGAQFSKLILINPALDKHIEFPVHIKEIHVFHTKHDKVVTLAKWSRKLLFWRKNFLWGEMGRFGYKGDDTRVINHDVSSISNWHSTIFKGKAFLKLQLEISNIVKS